MVDHTMKITETEIQALKAQEAKDLAVDLLQKLQPTQSKEPDRTRREEVADRLLRLQARAPSPATADESG